MVELGDNSFLNLQFIFICYLSLIKKSPVIQCLKTSYPSYSTTFFKEVTRSKRNFPMDDTNETSDFRLGWWNRAYHFSWPKFDIYNRDLSLLVTITLLSQVKFKIIIIRTKFKLDIFNYFSQHCTVGLMANLIACSLLDHRCRGCDSRIRAHIYMMNIWL